jgi:hypothetical protein
LYENNFKFVFSQLQREALASSLLEQQTLIWRVEKFADDNEALKKRFRDIFERENLAFENLMRTTAENDVLVQQACAEFSKIKEKMSVIATVRFS